jgi:transposase
MEYGKNFKQAMVRKLLLPGGPSVMTLSREIGVSEQSLYNWKAKYQTSGSSKTPRSPRQWTQDDKYEALLESNGEQKARFHNGVGLFVIIMM